MKIVTDFVEKKDKSFDIKESGSSYRLCSICGGNHNVLIIGVESGGHIITEHFFKEGPVKIKFDFNINRKATMFGLQKSHKEGLFESCHLQYQGQRLRYWN